jgi:hypothetical protein
VGVGVGHGAFVAVGEGEGSGVAVGGGPSLVQTMIVWPNTVLVPGVTSVPAAGSVRVTSPAGRLLGSAPWLAQVR